MNVGLVPLRVPSGWMVQYNALLETVDSGVEQCEILLKENLLLMVHPYRRRIIDIGWYPEGQTHGEYCLLAVEQHDEGVNHLAYWRDPIVVYKTKELNALKEKLNFLLQEITEGKM